jgi:uncharacterized protein (TIGR03437 family)
MRVFLFLTIAVQAAFSASLATSTYLRDGFIPSALASDPQGNIYVAGMAITDPVTLASGAAVIKVNANATQYVYFSQLDSAASDQISAIAVDGAGNAYVTGWTTNPNFPVFGSAFPSVAPSGDVNDYRSFVMKLNSQGGVIFSLLLGGTAPSQAKAIALTSQGQILISGIATGSGFPATSGTYAVPDSKDQWFLTELDPGATRTVFSATGIGGTSIALGPAGDIYVAGSTTTTDYPTTPGAYQTQFVQSFYCFGFCRFGFPGGLQHVTRTDASATRIIYSTGLNDPSGQAGNTVNTGLAVDAAGDAYVTGTLLESKYPFTVDGGTDGANGYLSKLDPTGSKLLFSIPAGGAGVQVDSAGAVYTGGTAVSINTGLPGLPGPPIPTFIPSFFSAIPSVCRPNFNTSVSSAYVLRIDPSNGNVQDGQWIAGSAPGATSITLAGGKVWITGPTPGPEVPQTPGAVVPLSQSAGFHEGVYLSAVDISNAQAGPSIACVLDSANLSHVGVVAPLQLISLFGANLGPAAPAAAPEGEASLGAVSVTFDGTPAKLLYASASQINVAVPAANLSVPKTYTTMRLTYGGGTIERQFPIVNNNLSLFADLSSSQVTCADVPVFQSGYQPLALNEDGSLNGCAHPAKAGSKVSLFLNGAGGFGSGVDPLSNFIGYLGQGCAIAPGHSVALNNYVLQVDLSLPSAFSGCGPALNGPAALPLSVSYNSSPVGPFTVPTSASGAQVTFALTSQPMPIVLWIVP